MRGIVYINFQASPVVSYTALTFQQGVLPQGIVPCELRHLRLILLDEVTYCGVPVLRAFNDLVLVVFLDQVTTFLVIEGGMEV